MSNTNRNTLDGHGSGLTGGFAKKNTKIKSRNMSYKG